MGWSFELEVGTAVALDQRPGTVDDQLAQTSLNQRRQLEPATKLVDDIVALERFDHEGRTALDMGQEGNPQL